MKLRYVALISTLSLALGIGATLSAEAVVYRAIRRGWM